MRATYDRGLGFNPCLSIRRSIISVRASHLVSGLIMCLTLHCAEWLSVRIRLAKQFLYLHSCGRSSVGLISSTSRLIPLWTSVPGYVYLAANPLPDNAFPSTSHFGLNDKCSSYGYEGYSLFARWVSMLLTCIVAVRTVGFTTLVPLY